MIIDLVVGTRPNFVKAASIVRAADEFEPENSNLKIRLIHTGQHYNDELSRSFFLDLGLPEPDVNLAVGSGCHAEQTAKIMRSYEQFVKEHRPNGTMVVGDVNSTMACALVAAKEQIPLIHVEAGIRSFDRKMPEEINRLVTDSISDVFFVTSEYAVKNLMREGVDPLKVVFVGNTMIDTLMREQEKLRPPESLRHWFSVSACNTNTPYYMLTIHRPENTVSLRSIDQIIEAMVDSVGYSKIIFPVHPRIKKMIVNLHDKYLNKVIFMPPLRYHEFNFLVRNSIAVVTDSGGVSEETAYFRIPCITLRNSTERPETVDYGTNFLIGRDMNKLGQLISSFNKEYSIETLEYLPRYWDGRAGFRIIDWLKKNGL